METLLGAVMTSKFAIIAWGAPSFQELVVILVIVLIIFGAKRLPELARSLGQSMNEFRKAKDEFEKELHKSAPATAVAPANQSNEEQNVPILQPAAQIVSTSSLSTTTAPPESISPPPSTENKRPS